MNTWTRGAGGGRGAGQAPSFQGKRHCTVFQRITDEEIGSNWITYLIPEFWKNANKGQGALRLYGQHLHLQNTYYGAQMRPSAFHTHK